MKYAWVVFLFAKLAVKKLLNQTYTQAFPWLGTFLSPQACFLPFSCGHHFVGTLFHFNHCSLFSSLWKITPSLQQDVVMETVLTSVSGDLIWVLVLSITVSVWASHTLPQIYCFISKKRIVMPDLPTSQGYCGDPVRQDTCKCDFVRWKVLYWEKELRNLSA